MEHNHKNLIQVIDETNNPDIEIETEDIRRPKNKYEERKRDFEEEDQEESQNVAQHGTSGKTTSKLAKKEAEKGSLPARNADLLRLEKNYFDGVYHEDNFKTVNDFLIKKMDDKPDKPKQKPQIGDFAPQSELLGRLRQFMPKFMEDTKELAQDPARAEKMNIDVMDEPTDDNKCIEMNLMMGVFDMKEKKDDQ